MDNVVLPMLQLLKKSQNHKKQILAKEISFRSSWDVITLSILTVKNKFLKRKLNKINFVKGEGNLYGCGKKKLSFFCWYFLLIFNFLIIIFIEK